MKLFCRTSLPNGAVFRPSRPRSREAVIALAIITFAVGCGVAGRNGSRRTVPTRVLTLPDGLQHANPASFAVSPDGRQIAVAGSDANGPGIFLVPVDRGTAQPLPGTGGGTQPFWSPDGRSIGFFAHQQLLRLDLETSAVQVLGAAPLPRGGAWASDGTILFSPGPGAGIVAMAAAGGDAVPLTFPADASVSHGWPQVLPGSRGFIYFVDRTIGADMRGVHVAGRDGREARWLVDSASSGVVVVKEQAAADGTMLTVRGDEIVAHPLNLETFVFGDGRTLDLVPARTREGATLMSAATTGLLIVLHAPPPDFELTWMHRDGRAEGHLLEGHRVADASLSASGQRIVIEESGTSGRASMRLFESGGRDLQAIAADGEPGTGAVWAPDESAVAFTSRAQPSQVFAVSTSGQSAARPLSTAAADPRFVREVVSDWSRDGRLLAVTRTWLDGNRDIWSVEAKPEGQSKPVVGSAANESEGRFSPDGAWLAYSSDESGVCEVYLITLEGATFRVRVSEGGGRAPLWSRDGQQLYFVDDRDVIWVASLAFDEVASVTKVERLFALGEPASTLGPHARPFFSLTADGGKWLAARPTANLARAPLTAFPDWSVLVAEAGRRDGS